MTYDETVEHVLKHLRATRGDWYVDTISRGPRLGALWREPATCPVVSAAGYEGYSLAYLPVTYDALAVDHLVDAADGQACVDRRELRTRMLEAAGLETEDA